MPTPKRTRRTSPARPGLITAGVFATVIAVTIVVTMVAYAAQDESRHTSSAAKTTSTLSPTGPVRPHQPITVVGIGDSVTAGTHCSCEAFVGLYAADLASNRGIKTSAVNLGLSGLTSSQLLLRLNQPGPFRDQVAKADIVLVTIGANDLDPLRGRWASGGCATNCYSPVIESVAQNVERIVATVRAARPDHPATILVTDYWDVFQDGDVGTALNGEPFEIWSDILTRAENVQICDGAQRAGAICVDLDRPFKGNGSKDPTSLLAADGDHPNSAGHQLIASTLLANTPLQIP
jgi:lysophospholipase L1-like esterase